MSMCDFVYVNCVVIGYCPKQPKAAILCAANCSKMSQAWYRRDAEVDESDSLVSFRARQIVVICYL